MRQILRSDQASPSDTFAAQSHAGGVGKVAVSVHTGGTWTLQQWAPTEDDPIGPGVWIDTDITFDDVGVKSFDIIEGDQFRLSGGNTGAVIWVQRPL